MSEVETDGYDWANLQPIDAAPDEGEPAETEEVQAEPSSDAETATERPRDPETGQFISAEKAEQKETERLLAGRFKTPEELERGYEELRALDGRRSNEIGELRQALESFAQATQNPRPQMDFEALLDENPSQAYMVARSSGDTNAIYRAREAWNDMAPGVVDLFEQNLLLVNKLGELEQQFQGLQQPVQQQQQYATLAGVYRQVQTANPDFEALRPEMQKIVDEAEASGYDPFTPAIESNDPNQALAALNHLALLARARTAGNLADQARIAATEHVQATERAKADAIVASASTSLSDAPEKTPGEKVAEMWSQYDITSLA